MSVIRRGRPSQQEPPPQAGVYRIIDKEIGRDSVYRGVRQSASPQKGNI